MSSTTNTFTSFFLPTNDQLIFLLKNSRSSPSLYPIPLKLLNYIAPHILSNIYHIIHESLTSGINEYSSFSNILLSLLLLKILLLTPHPLITIDLFPISQYFLKP